MRNLPNMKCDVLLIVNVDGQVGVNIHQLYHVLLTSFKAPIPDFGELNILK